MEKFREYLKEVGNIYDINKYKFHNDKKSDSLTPDQLKRILREIKSTDDKLKKELDHFPDLRDFKMIKMYITYLEKMKDVIGKGTA